MPNSSRSDALEEALARRRRNRSVPVLAAFNKTIEAMLELLGELKDAPAIAAAHPSSVLSFEELVVDMMMWAEQAERLVCARRLLNPQG